MTATQVRDPRVSAMVALPLTVVSTTLREPLDWADATVISGDAVDVVARLKEESDAPLRSHGSLAMNRALTATGAPATGAGTGSRQSAQRAPSSRSGTSSAGARIRHASLTSSPSRSTSTSASRSITSGACS